MNLPLFKIRCRLCSNWRSRFEFVIDPVIGFCWDCYDRHQAAQKVFLEGTPPVECPECKTSFDDLSGAGDTKMYLHRKDGILQLLCTQCSEAYEMKRRDQFGATPHGLKR